jgi:hypothetical protein
MSSKKFASLRHNKGNKRLMDAYKKANGGYNGIELALTNLKQSKKGRERRLALAPFYPIAEDEDDDKYEDD